MAGKTNIYSKLLSFYFGHTSFREGQLGVITAIGCGEDVLAIQPTGAGKSICFQIPALKLTSGYALVISPLKSLIIDQLTNLGQKKIPAFGLYGGADKKDKAIAFDAIRAGKCRLLYVTPEQLQWRGLLEFLARYAPQLIVFDEAHCVSQWGHDFRPSYKKAAEVVKHWRDKQHIPLALFTATATAAVARDICNLVGAKRPRLFLGRFVRSNLHYLAIESEFPRRVFLKYVASFADHSAIIFCATIKVLETASRWLAKERIGHTIYHGRLDKDERRSNQARWTDGSEKIIICTSAFGMGVDKSNVRLVFHLGLPLSIEAYQQEAGRGGRDGNVTQCVVCYNQKDIATGRYLLNKGRHDQQDQRKERFQLMLEYLETSNCRVVHLSNYFNANERVEDCGNCDVCCSRGVSLVSQPEYLVLALIHSLAGSQRAGGYGSRMLSEILHGSESPRILKLKFQFHPMWGKFKHMGENVQSVIQALLEKRLVKRTTGRYPIILMTVRGSEAYRHYIRERRARPLDEMDIEERVYEFDSLRTAIAQRLALPISALWSDAANRLIAEEMPVNRAALAAMDSIPPNVALLYAKEIIEATKRMNIQREKDHTENDRL